MSAGSAIPPVYFEYVRESYSITSCRRILRCDLRGPRLLANRAMAGD